MFKYLTKFSTQSRILHKFKGGATQSLFSTQQWVWSRRHQSSNPHLPGIYDRLRHQSESDTPLYCNFSHEVLDYWAYSTQQQAIRYIDQDTDHEGEISYPELIIQSHCLADFFLNEEGLKKGDAVALMLGQQPLWWCSLAGLMRAGIAVVPCPRLLTAQDLHYRINDLQIRGIVTTPELQPKVDEIRGQCSSLTSCLTIAPHNTQGWKSLPAVLDKEKRIMLSRQHTTTADPCLYLYTSGTTGQPKAVQHNHDYPVIAHWTTGSRWMQATPDDIIYNASDTGWGFTVWTTLAAWSMGAKLLVTPTNKKFDVQKILTILSQEHVTIFCAAPTVLRRLVAEPNFNDYQFPSLKRVVTVGEALDETVIQQLESKGIAVHVGFGQAETPLLIGRVDDQLHVRGTMGKTIHPYHVVVLDENLNPEKTNKPGQIAVDLQKGSPHGIMRGYANALERTAQAFTEDGRYYLTGDWASCSRHGYFFYDGRKDDLIKSRGYRIGPDEIEKVGMSHPAVAKIAVFQIPESGTLGHRIKACILLKPHYQASPELIQSIKAHIKHETGPYKRPDEIECLELEEWSQYETTSGKIRRRGLSDRELERSGYNKDNQPLRSDAPEQDTDTPSNQPN